MESAQPAPAPSILVVDDEPGLRRMLAYGLAPLGYRVVTATGGAEALDLVKREDFSVVLCDIMMPGMTGLETLRALKELRPALRVVIMTGCPSDESALETARSGALDYIAKPFRLEELAALLARAAAGAPR